MERSHSQYFKLLFILYLTINTAISQSLLAQSKDFRLSLNTSGLYSGGQDLPFWLTSNRQGIFTQPHNTFALVDLSLYKNLHDTTKGKWDYFFGLRGLELKGKSNYFQANEWFAGVRYEFMKIQFGAWPEETLYHGLSSTNGDMRWSNNARPMPRIRLSTNDFIAIPFMHEWYVNAVYDEGILNDNRYVKNTHLHHKLLYLRKEIKKNLLLTFGLDHYNMWGGTSPEIGELPGFDSYLRYVLALKGSKKFRLMDQQYVAGNSLGRYYLKFEKLKLNSKLTWYLDHPFDDRVTMQNVVDNLIGFVYESNKKNPISDFLIELMFTNDQNVTRRTGLDANGNIIQNYGEYYFQHQTYLSGFSYDYRMITSPFFAPLVIIDGVNLGTGNNRILLFHTGLGGYISNHFKWKTLLSLSSNKGSFRKNYDLIKPGFFDHWKNQISAFGELNYQIPNKGWDFSFSIAADKGEMLENQVGVQLSARKSISF